MKYVERVVWFGCIALMIVTILLNNAQRISKKEPEQPKITPITEETPYIRISAQGMEGYSSETDFTYQNGFSDDRLTISKNNSNISLEIRIAEQSETVQDFQNRITEEIFDGPNGWKYYFEPNWDSDPKTKAYENIRKVFFREHRGVLVKAYQYDYTGGMYDREIEEILKGVEFF